MTALLRKVSTDDDYYHGVPVLRLHVDDPIPTPRAPQRFAVRVYPDLARYLLTFNHPKNRNHKPSAITRYSRDMVMGFWSFTPESVVFSTAPMLEDGQNRLRAVEQAGVDVWMMFDFGWPEDLIERINRGSSRTNGDAFSANGYKNAAGIAAAIGIARKFDLTVGTPSVWSGQLLTASESLELYRETPDEWTMAGEWGNRAYAATQGLGLATWSAAYYVIAKYAGENTATGFFHELVEESGEVGSATRRLKSHYLRRKLKDTKSGDRREPIENIVRAFNAWSTDKPVGFVGTGGAFVLTPVRRRK